MANVYKRTNRKYIPANAVIKQSIKAMPAGAVVNDGIAKWTDRDGCKRSATVKGQRIVSLIAEWTDSNGVKSAPVDHMELVILLVDPHYTAGYTIGTKRFRKSTKVSDKAVAQRIANQWEADERLRREGVIDKSLERLSEHVDKPIGHHVDAYTAFRSTKGTTDEHRTRTRKHITEFIEAGNWKRIDDIHVDDVTKHVAGLKKGGSSARTIEARLQSIKGFTKWLTDNHRIRFNPLSMVSKPDPTKAPEHERRMLLPLEWRWLSRSLEQSARLHNSMNADERLLLYRLAIQTGLRAGELSELIRANLKLSAKHPYVLCKASTTKDGKSARQFVDPVLAIDLRSHISRKHPAAKVFNIGSKDELSRSLERDLTDSRRLWLESLSDQEQGEAGDSDFLCKTNHSNEHLVFHSLRHTCGSWLAQSGASIKVVQTVMRHSTPELTIRRYGHLFPGECEAAPIQIAAMMTGEPEAKMRRPNETRKHA